MPEPSKPRALSPEELAFERIVYEKAPPRATVTLNRPDVLNAFDFLMLRELARTEERHHPLMHLRIFCESGSVKRGGGAVKVALDEVEIAAKTRAVELLALDEALEKLATFDKRKADVVEMRYFGGLTMEEIADVLKVHVNTVTREWSAARAWLFATLSGEEINAI